MFRNGKIFGMCIITLISILLIASSVGAADWVWVDDGASAIVKSIGWTVGNVPGNYKNTESYTNNVNAYAQYTFTGTSVQVIGYKDANLGIIDIYIDNVKNATVDLYASMRGLLQSVLYQKTDLTNASHTIKLVCTGTKNASSYDSYLQFDALKYLTGGTVTSPTPTATVSQTATPTVTVVVPTATPTLSSTSTITPTSTPGTNTMKMGTNFWDISWGIYGDTFKSGVNWATTTDPWNPTFVEEIQLYKCLRFMDWVPTNDVGATSWSTRVQKTSNQSVGVAYEWQVDLCNKIGADIWVNIPHTANWDYSYQLAQLLNNQLNSNLKIYVEWSNETWNNGFAQSSYCSNQGVALNLPGDNQWYKGWSYTVYASVRVFEQFERVFGKDSPRIIKVLAGQAGYVGENNTAEICTHHMTCLKNSTVNPNGTRINSYAIAPYMDGNSVAELRNSIPERVQWCQNHLNSIANANIGYPINLIAYEGGQHCLNGADSVNRNSGMYQLYIDYFNAMKGKINGIFCHYLHVGSWNSGGAWGSMEYTGQPISTAHKYRAIVDWINSN